MCPSALRRRYHSCPVSRGFIQSIYIGPGGKYTFSGAKYFLSAGRKCISQQGLQKRHSHFFAEKKRMRANGGGRKAGGLRRGHSGAADGGKRRGSEAVSAVRFRAVSRPPFTRFSADFHPVFARFSSLLYIEDKTRRSRPKSARCKTAFRRRAAARKTEFARRGNCCCTAGLPRRGGSTRGRRPRAGKCRIGNARAVARYRRGRAANHVELCPVIFWAQDVVLQRFHVKQSETYAAHFRADNVSCETFLHGEM